jgi:hypothetical protein
MRTRAIVFFDLGFYVGGTTKASTKDKIFLHDNKFDC